jgi:hypothetical protein
MLKRGITLYFVRHGETDWNAVRRYQGQTDTPLNDKGRGQAARNGRTAERFDVGDSGFPGEQARSRNHGGEGVDQMEPGAGRDFPGQRLANCARDIGAQLCGDFGYFLA